MIDRDRVLPRISGERLDALAVELQYSSSTMIPGRGGYEARLTEISVEAQRDADWARVEELIKRMKVLIKLIRELAILLRDFGGTQEERRSSMHRRAAEALDEADAVLLGMEIEP